LILGGGQGGDAGNRRRNEQEVAVLAFHDPENTQNLATIALPIAVSVKGA
jgi:hypothetical protein